MTELEEALEIAKLIREGKPVPCGKGPADPYIVAFDEAYREQQAKILEFQDKASEDRSLRIKLEAKIKELSQELSQKHIECSELREKQKYKNARIAALEGALKEGLAVLYAFASDSSMVVVGQTKTIEKMEKALSGGSQ